METKLEESRLGFRSDLFAEFDRRKWEFIPAKFGICNSKVIYSNYWILPFCKKDLKAKGGMAEVYRVLLPEDLAPNSIKEVLWLSKMIHKEYGSV